MVLYAYSWFFLPCDTTITNNQYLEPQFCLKFAILNTQSTVLQSKTAVLGPKYGHFWSHMPIEHFHGSFCLVIQQLPTTDV